jgi:hypothetical protein
MRNTALKWTENGGPRSLVEMSRNRAAVSSFVTLLKDALASQSR